MRIVCTALPFNKWRAELWDEDEKLATAVMNRPACAMREVLNEFCYKYEEMPKEKVIMEIVVWE